MVSLDIVASTVATLEALPSDMLQSYRQGVADRFVTKLDELPEETTIMLINGNTLNGVFASELLNRALALAYPRKRFLFELTGNIAEKLPEAIAFADPDQPFVCILLDIEFTVDILLESSDATHVLWFCSQKTNIKETSNMPYNEAVCDLLIDHTDSVANKVIPFVKAIMQDRLETPEFNQYLQVIDTALKMTVNLSESTSAALPPPDQLNATEEWSRSLNSWFDLSPNAHSRLREFVRTPSMNLLFMFIEEGDHIETTRHYVSDKTIREQSVIKQWTILGREDAIYRVAIIFHSDKLVSLYNRLLNFYNGEAEFAIIASLTQTGKVRLNIRSRPGMDAMDLAKYFNGKGDQHEAFVDVSFSQLSCLMNDMAIFR